METSHESAIHRRNCFRSRALSRRRARDRPAQDNDSRTWDAYGNQYWPAQYIVDQNGNIVFEHAGEGRYDEIEHTIARLLNANS
jgi:hypothetical protein